MEEEELAGWLALSLTPSLPSLSLQSVPLLPLPGLASLLHYASCTLFQLILPVSTQSASHASYSSFLCGRDGAGVGE